MKTKYRILPVLLLAAALAVSCKNLLELESATDITSNWLYESPEGLSHAVVGLYNRERSLSKGTDNDHNAFIVLMCDYSTDLLVFRGGTEASSARLDNTLTASRKVFSEVWDHYYNIIGKANEIIAAAQRLGLDDPTVAQAYAEACFFRGRAYFILYEYFERLYLNTEATEIGNLIREFKPASEELILNRIREDLDTAVEELAWELPAGKTSPESGRVTKATAMHVRAQLAMWEREWGTAISLCEEIFAHTATCAMAERQEDVFLSGPDLNSKEILWALQYSKNLGGGGTGTTTLKGHDFAWNTLPQYHGISGFVYAANMGGAGKGRIYPNSYLLSLYDKTQDTRYTKMFGTQLVYNDPNMPETFGTVLDPKSTKNKYMQYAHPFTKKYFDCWTNADQPDLLSSFKDISIYRMGETALMACEAYFHRDGGASANALRFYNATWERAGNPHENGPLTLDMILDEYARECCFEGVRWPLLKRLGLLGERVRLHAGDTKAEDPCLDKAYDQARKNFVPGKHDVWPIPQTFIDLVGADNFPQHESWQ